MAHTTSVVAAHQQQDACPTFNPQFLHSVYQPIVEMSSKEIIGYEALTRGRGKWRQPENLFRWSYEEGKVIALDFDCLHVAVRILPKLGEKKLLFLNVEPMTLGHTFMKGKEGDYFLRTIGEYAHQVVFELTEGMKARDFEYVKRGLLFVRKAGCHFALDDVAGLGSKLMKLIDLGPNFIKIDMGLVKGISTNHLHQKLIRQLVKLGNEKQSIMVAEGVENKEDLNFVRQMGITHAQGFYFARPKRFLQKTVLASSLKA